MKINKVIIDNFRGIQHLEIELKNLSIIIGNNGTSKTTILEAIHYALTPFYVQNKVDYSDFYNGEKEPIKIEVFFDETFYIPIQFGFQYKQIPFNKIHLNIKKRDSARGLKKSFNSGFVINHCLVPVYETVKSDGYIVNDKDGKSHPITLLQAKDALSNIPFRSFYFNKERDKQLTKGYNSSISSIFEDFNWRLFVELEKNPENTYVVDKEKLEKTIIEHINEGSWDKSFKVINEKLVNSFGLKSLDLSFIDKNNPFNSAFLSNKECNLDLPISKLGSGIEMIASLTLLETLASLSKENIIILIDEPELHLHPTLQYNLLKYFITIPQTDATQIMFSTHSPYMFKDCKDNDEITMIRREGTTPNSLFPWGPSWGEINYFSFGLPTVEFFNELYGYIQDKHQKIKITETDSLFSTQGIIQDKKWHRIKDGKAITDNLTIISYIRNSIHHPENTQNVTYTSDELNQSILDMVSLIQKGLL